MNTKYLRDLAERAVATGVEVFLAAVGLDALNLVTLDGVKSAALAGAGAALSVLKSAIAKYVGSRASASLDPAVGDDAGRLY